jgi:hypothetical protein
VLTTFRLLFHLRKLILSKNARPSTDFNALIEKRHRDANLKIFKNANPGDAQTRTNTTKPKRKRAESSGRARSSRQVSLTDESSDLSETPDDSTMDSEDSIVRPAARGRVKAKARVLLSEWLFVSAVRFRQQSARLSSFSNRTTAFSLTTASTQ